MKHPLFYGGSLELHRFVTKDVLNKMMPISAKNCNTVSRSFMNRVSSTYYYFPPICLAVLSFLSHQTCFRMLSEQYKGMERQVLRVCISRNGQ